jgi:hypothetical protein
MSWLSQITGIDKNFFKEGLEGAFGKNQGDALYTAFENKNSLSIVKWATSQIFGVDKGAIVYAFIASISTSSTTDARLELIKLSLTQALGTENGTNLYNKYESEIVSYLATKS